MTLDVDPRKLEVDDLHQHARSIGDLRARADAIGVKVKARASREEILEALAFAQHAEAQMDAECRASDPPPGPPLGGS